MAETTPISDANIAEWERYVTQFDGTNNRLVRIAFFPRADLEGLIARIRAEQRRGDEEFNAGVEACAVVDDAHATELRGKHRALANHFFMPTEYPELLARADEHDRRARVLRALKRPIPTKEAPPHG